MPVIVLGTRHWSFSRAGFCEGSAKDDLLYQLPVVQEPDQSLPTAAWSAAISGRQERSFLLSSWRGYFQVFLQSQLVLQEATTEGWRNRFSYSQHLDPLPITALCWCFPADAKLPSCISLFSFLVTSEVPDLPQSFWKMLLECEGQQASPLWRQVNPLALGISPVLPPVYKISSCLNNADNWQRQYKSPQDRVLWSDSHWWSIFCTILFHFPLGSLPLLFHCSAIYKP